MKKKIFLTLSIILFLIVVFLVGKYFWTRQYVKGSFDSYINIQKIPNSRIKRKKIYFNWINMGSWEEHLTIESKGQKYDYVYTMGSGDLPVVLNVYKHNSNLNADERKLEYPPLNNLD